MSDNQNSSFDKKIHQAVKLGADRLQRIPVAGETLVYAADRLCGVVDVMNDHFANRTDDTRGTACDAVRESLVQHLGNFTAPSAPVSDVGHAKESPRRR